MSVHEDSVMIRKFVDAFASDRFVVERTRDNVDGPAPTWDQERFWRVLVGCLLTTQQRSTTGSAVDRFMATKPFPLALNLCRTQPVLEFVHQTLTDFGGIRFTSKIARQVKENVEMLKNGGWTKVERLFNQLRSQREREPQPSDKKLERDAARLVDGLFSGFGPKQSRNFWQWLGLTRYEIPLDSRVAKWVNASLSFKMDVNNLAYANRYEAYLDRIQEACAAAGVLPCVLDAAAFNDENKSVSNLSQLDLKMTVDPRGTTLPGYVNRNGQVTVRDTGMPGTDHLQRVYQLACSKCGHVYGANGSDVHDRKCPKCQAGAMGLPLEMKAHA